jgi:hypothetical protein
MEVVGCNYHGYNLTTGKGTVDSEATIALRLRRLPETADTRALVQARLQAMEALIAAGNDGNVHKPPFTRERKALKDFERYMAENARAYGAAPGDAADPNAGRADGAGAGAGAVAGERRERDGGQAPAGNPPGNNAAAGFAALMANGAGGAPAPAASGPTTVGVAALQAKVDALEAERQAAGALGGSPAGKAARQALTDRLEELYAAIEAANSVGGAPPAPGALNAPAAAPKMLQAPQVPRLPLATTTPGGQKSDGGEDKSWDDSESDTDKADQEVVSGGRVGAGVTSTISVGKAGTTMIADHADFEAHTKLQAIKEEYGKKCGTAEAPRVRSFEGRCLLVEACGFLQGQGLAAFRPAGGPVWEALQAVVTHFAGDEGALRCEAWNTFLQTARLRGADREWTFRGIRANAATVRHIYELCLLFTIFGEQIAKAKATYGPHPTEEIWAQVGKTMHRAFSSGLPVLCVSAGGSLDAFAEAEVTRSDRLALRMEASYSAHLFEHGLDLLKGSKGPTGKPGAGKKQLRAVMSITETVKQLVTATPKGTDAGSSPAKGGVRKCFLCKQEGHLKIDCPRNKKVKKEQ